MVFRLSEEGIIIIIIIIVVMKLSPQVATQCGDWRNSQKYNIVTHNIIINILYLWAENG